MTERTFEDIELDLKLFQIKLDNAEELEENSDFILTVNSETLSLEESYDNRINLVSKEIMDYENALDKLYYEKQSLMQKSNERKGG